MPKVTYKEMNFYKINDENTLIVLKNPSNNDSEFLIWIGNMNLQDKKEEPLILNFEDNETYFYLENFQKINENDLKKLGINSETNKQFQINEVQQKEIINHLIKNINQNDLNQKLILLELKNDYLEKQVKNLEETNKSLLAENQFFDLETKFLKVRNGLVDKYNQVTNDLTTKKNVLILKENKKLHKKNDELKKYHKIQNLESNKIKDTNNNLLHAIELSFEVHEEIAKKSEELLKEKAWSKRQYRTFVQRIKFITDTILNKFHEETKELNKDNFSSDKQNRYSDLLKEYYNQTSKKDSIKEKVSKLNKNQMKLEIFKEEQEQRE